MEPLVTSRMANRLIGECERIVPQLNTRNYEALGRESKQQLRDDSAIHLTIYIQLLRKALRPICKLPPIRLKLSYVKRCPNQLRDG